MLNDGSGTRDAATERPPPDDLEQRQDDHRQKSQRRDEILDERQSGRQAPEAGAFLCNRCLLTLNGHLATADS